MPFLFVLDVLRLKNHLTKVFKNDIIIIEIERRMKKWFIGLVP